jgi:hypothetical protein
MNKEELDYALNEYQNFLKVYVMKIKTASEEFKPFRAKSLKMIGGTSKVMKDNQIVNKTEYQNDFKDQDVSYFKEIQEQIKSALNIAIKEMLELEEDKIKLIYNKFEDNFITLSALIFKNIVLEERDLDVSQNVDKLISSL